MEDIKISVITATYNAQKYLPRLIESLENQTDKDFEWVVADGSYIVIHKCGWKDNL